MNTIIEAKDLTKSFVTPVNSNTSFLSSFKSLIKPEKKLVHAVQGINFSIKAGERVAFIGPNGAGKSTTIKMLCGILTPSSGDLRVADFCPSKKREKLAYEIGCVFGQKSQLWYHLPAKHSFELLGKIYDLPSKLFKERLEELSRHFEISDFMDRAVRSLSLGQRMRCEIVASLLHSPKILFLDEPTIGLDVNAKAVIRDLILKVSKEQGTTIIFTSHDTGDIESVCDRVLMINQGQILLDQSIEMMRKSYIHKKRIRFLTKEKELELSLSGIELIEKKPYQSFYEVDTRQTQVDEVIKEALSKTRLRDITVEDPPLEEVIQQIYAGSLK